MTLTPLVYRDTDAHWEIVAHWEIHTMNTIVLRAELGLRNLNEASPSHLM